MSGLTKKKTIINLFGAYIINVLLFYFVSENLELNWAATLTAIWLTLSILVLIYHKDLVESQEYYLKNPAERAKQALKSLLFINKIGVVAFAVVSFFVVLFIIGFSLLKLYNLKVASASIVVILFFVTSLILVTKRFVYNSKK